MRTLLITCLLTAGALCPLPALARAPLPFLSNPFAQQPDVQDIVLLTPDRPIFIRLHLTINGKPYRRAWQGFFRYLHNYLDVDKDGLLCADEQDNLPDLKSLFGIPVRWRYSGISFENESPRSPPGERIVLTNRVRPKPSDVQTLRRESRDDGVLPFRTFSNDDDAVVKAVLLLQPKIKMDASSLNRGLHERLDADHDGRVSLSELRSAERLLLRQDFDDDEAVTTREALGVFYQSDGVGQVIFIPTSAPSLPNGGSRLIDVTSPSPDDAKRLSERLLTRYSRRVDKKPLHELRRAEIGLPSSIFAALDKNNNKALDVHELGRFTLRKPDIEVTMELGPKPSVRATQGKLVNSATSTIVRVGSVSLNFRAARRDPRRYDRPETKKVRESAFAKADRDKNGYLDVQEAQSAGYLASMFKLIDADNDGRVTMAEGKAFDRHYAKLHERAQHSCVSLDAFEDRRGLFGLIDENQDDRLSVRELRKAIRSFKQLDHNRDGSMSLDEMPRQYNLTFVAGSLLHVEETSTQAPIPEARYAPIWFNTMDRNRDGDVSAREFLGKTPVFEQIDADGDGLLSPKEAVLADKRFRRSR